MEMPGEVPRDEVTDRSFDMVQEEIKKLATADGVKNDKIEELNNQIMDMGAQKIKDYFDAASEHNRSVEEIAKVIYDEYSQKVKNNMFNQNDPHGVPNMLKKEKSTMNFEEFQKINEMKIGDTIKKEFSPIKIGETKYPLSTVQLAYQAGQKSILDMPSIIKILNKYPSFVGNFSKDIPQFNDWWEKR
jgi:hypothetical protein